MQTRTFKSIVWVLGYGFLSACLMPLFLMLVAAIVPRHPLFKAILDGLCAPAMALEWLWGTLAFPPHGEAALAMPLAAAFVQWFLIGSLFGRWRFRKRQKRAATPTDRGQGGF
jgi:hypothetical protein